MVTGLRCGENLRRQPLNERTKKYLSRVVSFEEEIEGNETLQNINMIFSY